jgi:ParB/RepB/Spo0J family partition protein
MALDALDVSQVEIEHVSPRSLHAHPRNTKIYGDESVDELKTRILASKWIKPLVVTSNNMIISGHRRWRAASELGLLSVPVERRTFANETEKLEALLLENESREKTREQKVREAQVWREIEEERATHRQSIAAIQTHVKLGIKSQEVLKENFPDAPKGQTRDKVAERVGFGTGRTYEKAAKVVETADRLAETGKVEDAFELLKTLNNKSVHKAYQQVKQQEKREEIAQLQQIDLPVVSEPVVITSTRPDVELGQTWRLGSHLLYCGDSASSEFQHLLSGKEAVFAFADPPYNAGVAEWDHTFQWKHDYLIDAAPVVAVTPGIASISNFMHLTTLPYRWSMAYWLDNGMTRGELGFGNWIYVALFSHGSLYRNAQDFERVSVSSNDRDELEHKGRKPLAMMLHLIKLFSKEGEIVIDPFLGTGSTLIVCEQAKRHCIGAEINPAYCESIIARWEKITGEKAELANV